MDSGAFPDKIIMRVLKRCPPDVAFNIGGTCRKYSKLLFQFRGVPISKAVFQSDGSHFDIYEEEPSKLTLDCGIKALRDPEVQKVLQETNLNFCDLQLVNLGVDDVKQIISTAKTVTPMSLTLLKSKLSYEDFRILTRRPLIGLHLTSDVVPFPKFEQILEITRFAEYLVMCVRKVQLGTNIKALLLNWDRTANLQCFKIRGAPPELSLQDIVEVSQRFAYPGLKFSVSYVESVSMDDIKNQLQTLRADFEIPADISLFAMHGEKLKMYLIPTFMRLSPAKLDMSVECFGISISF
ncbi:hypothetical protein FO519_004540 [Halicephalobus sp. NKZ332]|nr:hypothetical protein FO519_004540 [Halicephalobus sp. NKZ332]